MRRLIVFILFIAICFSDIPTGADLLIIGPDEYEDDLQPLIDWKIQKGVLTKYCNLTDVGASSTEIETFVDNAYASWVPAPRYLLIIGTNSDIEMVAAGSTIYGTFYSDWTYGNISGSMESEILTGRLPAYNSTELQIMVSKIIEYERNPSSGFWLKKGTCIINEDGDDSDSIYYANADTAKADMLDAGYLSVDVFNDGDGANDNGDVVNAIDEGRGFVVYRGIGTSNWYPPFDIDPRDLENHGMYPVVFSSTCNTVTSTGSAMIDVYFLRAGTVEEPKGAVAYFGSTSSISDGAHLRGEVVEGFTESFYSDTTNDLALACETGRLQTLAIYSDEVQYKSHMLIGDPEMDIRTDVPGNLDVNHPLVGFATESNMFDINVTDFDTGLPVAGVRVCLYKEGDVFEVAITDASGNASLTFNPDTDGTIFVTATAKNYYPYESFADIIIDGANIYFSSYSINDVVGGNGDGLLNPGETAELTINLGNNGTEGSFDVSAILSEDDPYVALSGTSSTFGDIGVGEVASSESTFLITVSDVVPKGYEVQFTLVIDDRDDNNWTREQPIIPIISADIQFVSYSFADTSPYGNGDGYFQSGETVKLSVEMINNANAQLSNVEITLIDEIDELYPEDDFSLDYAWNAFDNYITNDDPFWLVHSDAAPIIDNADITLLIHGDGYTYEFYDTVEFALNLEGCSIPPADNYGYYVYDDTDIETGRAPVFSWTEINGIGTNFTLISNADDRIVTYDLPFDFSFYGISSSYVSVCSNGFISIGVETWTGGSTDGHERHIPTAGQASSMIAAFWDDLAPSSVGNVYGYNDAANHRYIIEFDDVAHYGRADRRETFQIILLDQDYYITPTGDGEIVLLYENVAYRYSNAIGIESPDETNGLEYLYHNSYTDYCPVLYNNRAIKFTTNPPLNDEPWVYIASYRIDDTRGGNGNLEIEEGESIELYVSLKNGSQVTASNTMASLSTSEPYITIDDNLSNYGSIAYDVTYENSSDPYEFTVSGLTDNENAQFELYITALSGSYTRTAPLTLPVWNALAIDDRKPISINMSQIYPNPFNSAVLIAAHENITLAILDLNGRLIAQDISLKKGDIWQWQPPSELNSGVYIVRTVDRDGRAVLSKMIYIK